MTFDFGHISESPEGHLRLGSLDVDDGVAASKLDQPVCPSEVSMLVFVLRTATGSQLHLETGHRKPPGLIVRDSHFVDMKNS